MSALPVLAYDARQPYQWDVEPGPGDFQETFPQTSIDLFNLLRAHAGDDEFLTKLRVRERPDYFIVLEMTREGNTRTLNAVQARMEPQNTHMGIMIAPLERRLRLNEAYRALLEPGVEITSQQLSFESLFSLFISTDDDKASAVIANNLTRRYIVLKRGLSDPHSLFYHLDEGIVKMIHMFSI